jgi:hypothetical protein
MDNIFKRLKKPQEINQTQPYVATGTATPFRLATTQEVQAYKSAQQKNPQQAAIQKARQEALNKLKQDKSKQVTYSVQPSGTYTTKAIDKPQKEIAPPTDTGQAQVKTDTTAGSTQATQTPDYMAQYQKYLQDREQRARSMAEEQYSMAQREAESVYNRERAGLQEQAQRAGESVQQYRQRIQQDLANLEAQRGRSVAGAREESGASQRQLAMTRRQQSGELERKYAALGTIDSYGVGSFTGANTNLEAEFLRQTNENFQRLENRIAEIDTSFNNAKIEGNRKIQDEENKYQEAVREINRLLAGNESLKTQALQQAASLLRQKQMEIQDDVENLRLQLEKEKYDTQQALQKETAKDQAIIAEFQALSESFKQSGVPQTAQDAFFANKYPEYMKNLKDIYTEQAKTGDTSTQGQEQKNEIITIIDNLRKTGGIGGITGFTGTGFIPGSKAAIAKAYYDQLQALLSLENRNSLKGSGAISDFEARLLEKAASALNLNLSETQFNQILNDLYQSLSQGGQTTTTGSKPPITSYVKDNNGNI